MSTKLLLGWVPPCRCLLCLELSWGKGAGVTWRTWGQGSRFRQSNEEVLVKWRGSILRVFARMLMNSAREEWRGSAEVTEDPAIEVQAFVVRVDNHVFLSWSANTGKSSLHLWTPVFTLLDVYKYFWKREMTCLCNIRLDLQSDAIVEPKTKARLMVLTNVNRRSTRGFTVEHWNKMCGLLDFVRWVSLLCAEKKYWLICKRGL